MGRGSEAACIDCQVRWDLGYGSYSTWMDNVKTVAEFDATADEHPDRARLNKNRNWRKVLTEHEEHRLYQWFEDYAGFNSDGRVEEDHGYKIHIEHDCDIRSWPMIDLEGEHA